MSEQYVPSSVTGLKKLNVTVTKTANGLQDYIQVMSADLISVNIVLIADKIEVHDYRPEGQR